MAMSEAALKARIIKVMNEIREETSDPEGSMEAFAQELSQAIVEEVRKMTITATCTHGPVTVQSIQ